VSSYIPNVWAESLLAQSAHFSHIAEILRRPDPYSRRGHYLNLPRWVRRMLPRRGWVWDESKRDYAARVAELPPRPSVIRIPAIGAGGTLLSAAKGDEST
jgi:hypothetical protein